MSTARSGAVIEGGMTLGELAQAVGGTVTGAARFSALATDSRTLQAGELFVALRGPNFDAHGFLEQARLQGACAALVDRPVDTSLPTVQVDDTRRALGRLAAYWRARFDLPLVAVTGSNGKTTTKEMLARILSARGPGLVTRGNLNNDIGVPLTLLGLNHGHRYAVIEMGASAAGDIDYLTHLARPTAALITNAAPAHLAGFRDVSGVARAKGEIFGGLGPDGTAIINGDDPHAGLWRVLAGTHRVVSFGLSSAADITASELQLRGAEGTSFVLRTPGAEARVELRLSGRHNVMNALAAAAAAGAVGSAVSEIVRGLESVVPVERRLQVKRGIGGARIIDDTYNANPGSVEAGLAVLGAEPAAAQKWLVLGDMGELGGNSGELHRAVGARARAAGVDRVYALGELAAGAAAAFGSGARSFTEQQRLTEALRADLTQATGPVSVLIKGSRMMRMERVTDAVVDPGREAGACDRRAGG